MDSLLDATLTANKQQHLHTLVKRLLTAADNGKAVLWFSNPMNGEQV